MKLKASAAAIGLMACGVLSAQTIEVQLGEKVGTIELNVNDAARSLLEQMPLKLKFEDFGSAERIAYLPQKLKLGSSPTSCAPSEGDLTYYIPWGNLAVFVKGWRVRQTIWFLLANSAIRRWKLSSLVRIGRLKSEL